jgi:ketosteroid isomerase-like protein
MAPSPIAGRCREEEGSVSEKSNREVVERYVQAMLERDLDGMDQLRHPDYVSEYPQSGERIRGPKNARAILEHYPGGLPPAANPVLRGGEDRWVTTPVGTLLRVTGTGDQYFGLFTVVYPGDPRPWNCATDIELRDGKVLKETIVFGAPFDAPAWRANWVERM